MSHYPPRETTIEVLLDVAKRTAIDCTPDHPEDIACAMICALEAAALTVQIMHERASG